MVIQANSQFDFSLTGALFTGLSLAFEEPGVREYPNKEVTTRTPSTLQVL
jgi:hypothetical protein